MPLYLAGSWKFSLKLLDIIHFYDAFSRKNGLILSSLHVPLKGCRYDEFFDLNKEMNIFSVHSLSFVGFRSDMSSDIKVPPPTRTITYYLDSVFASCGKE